MRSPLLVVAATGLVVLPPMLNPAMPWAWTPWLPDETLRLLGEYGLLEPLMVADALTGCGLTGAAAVIATLSGRRMTAVALLLPCAAISLAVGALPYGLTLLVLAAVAGYAYTRPSQSAQYRSASF